MSTITLSPENLFKIAHATETATRVMTSLALRERQRSSSNLLKLERTLKNSGEKIVHADFIRMWRDLEAASLGKILYSRAKNPVKFEWYVDLKSVAKAAIENKAVEAVKIETVAQKVADKIPAGVKKTIRRKKKAFHAITREIRGTGKKHVVFNIREGMDVEFTVPSDLSKEEADQAVKILQAMTA